MKLGYVILFVPDVPAAVSFYEAAFGLKQRFVDPVGYGEMETGSTALAFVSEELLRQDGLSFRSHKNTDEEAAGVEVAFVTNDPKADFDIAVAAGAIPVKEPTEKPWGQTVAYVRDLNGFLVELCSPVKAP